MLNHRFREQSLLELARALPIAARELQLAPGGGFVGNLLVERIIAALEQRCALTTRRLTETDSEDGTAI